MGKSTTTANLSAALSDMGYRVLQIGCDPKADSTRNLTSGRKILTVLDAIREKGEENVEVSDILYQGYGNVWCVEAGGPTPGIGCAGRGIIAAFEKLEETGAYDICRPDIVMYDVLGDVVCGGFAMPIRGGYAREVFVVSSGEMMSALLFGALAVALVFVVTGTGAAAGRRPMIMVILAGMVVSSLYSSLVSLIKYTADPQDVLPVITFWLMGSFSAVTKRTLMFSAPCILGGILLLFLLRFRLNALSLLADEARSLGLNLRLIRTLVILGSTACTAAVVASCGLIGWVGLLIPHICRMGFGNNNARVIPFSILTGALFMLITDTAARCLVASEIPVSILTAVIGAPVFILLLRRTGGFQT